MQTRLASRELVLLGIGHTNAHIVRQWGMNPLPDVRLTCISNFPIATYSGMLPGVLTGQYADEAMQVDLVRLCQAVDARLLLDQVVGLDLPQSLLRFAARPPLKFDWLSIGVGSVPARRETIAPQAVLTIKPMQTFLQRLRDHLAPWRTGQRSGVLRWAVVGAGVSGVEIACCLPGFLRRELPQQATIGCLIGADCDVGRGTRPATQRLLRSALDRHRVEVQLERRIAEVSPGRMVFDSGESLEADVVIWAAAARPAPWTQQLGLPVADDGFLATKPTLQSLGDDRIFVVGDSGSIVGTPFPKAGVYAVREGPVLWQNLQASVLGQPLTEYRPQRDFLKLINTGDGRAIAEYRGWSVWSRWAWRWKHRIDHRFIAMYQNPTAIAYGANNGTGIFTRNARTPGFRWAPWLNGRAAVNKVAMAAPGVDAEEMRCTGCGNKIGGGVLARSLARLAVPAHDQVDVGLERPNDAAIIRPRPGLALSATVDFFTAPLQDAYLVGRIAALHAASDVFAMGGEPVAALALASLPLGTDEAQEALLTELLGGCLRELSDMGATLVGGHTTEGHAISFGLTLLANQVATPPRIKGALQPDDQLYLTKSLGTGVLLAAHQRARCRADWLTTLVDSMLQSNRSAAQLADELQLRAATDVTGFGLAGHLLEMLRASGCAATIWLNAIPCLPGALEMVEQGIGSTLLPANRRVELEMHATEDAATNVRYPLLFDPQTSGGLLLAVPGEKVAAWNALIDRRMTGRIVPIGRVTGRTDDRCRLTVSLTSDSG